MKFLIFAFTLSLNFSAQALVPEYEFFSDGESGEINSPRLIDGEYQSDKLTYLYPADFQFQWISTDKAFQYSAGSLGPTRFLTRGRLKARFDLNEKLDIKFIWLERGDYEGARQNFIFDFSYQTLNWLGFSVFGQPNTEKKKDSVGVAINLGSNPENQLRLFHTWVYFSHNKRNENDDRFHKKPTSSGLVWRTFNKERVSYKEWFVRYDTELIQFFPNENRLYQFQDLIFSLQGEERLTESFDYVEYQFKMRKKHEADSSNTDQGIRRWERESMEALVRYKNPKLWADWIGLKYVYTQWKSVQGNVIHNDLLPHFWIPLNSSDQSVGSLDWRLGYEFNWHRGQGDAALRSTLDTNNRPEHRANLRLDLWFKDGARLYTLLTFDLDQFGSHETWEGGSMQFSTQF